MTQPPKRAKNLGTSLNWTDAEIEHLATVSDADKKAASALWRNEAPARYKTLLEATETEKGN